jgi:hypothetical protein
MTMPPPLYASTGGAMPVMMMYPPSSNPNFNNSYDNNSSATFNGSFNGSFTHHQHPQQPPTAFGPPPQGYVLAAPPPMPMSMPMPILQPNIAVGPPPV